MAGKHAGDKKAPAVPTATPAAIKGKPAGTAASAAQRGSASSKAPAATPKVATLDASAGAGPSGQADFVSGSAADRKRLLDQFRQLPLAEQPTLLKGITWRGLKKLGERVKALVQEGHFKDDMMINNELFKGVEAFEDLTTTQLVYGWVKDEKVTGSCRLADCPAHIDPAHLGKPSFFISHAWKGRFSVLLKEVSAFLGEKPAPFTPHDGRHHAAHAHGHVAKDDVVLWLDVVAINQHHDTNPAQNEADVDAFKSVLRACDRGTIVILDIDKCNTATRSWCLYEWDWTLTFHSQKGIFFRGLASKQAARLIETIDVERSECQEAKDRVMILRCIKEHHGSSQAFNQKLIDQLKERAMASDLVTAQATVQSMANLYAELGL